MNVSGLLLVKLAFISTYKQVSLGQEIFAADHRGHSTWFYFKKLHYRALFTTSSIHFATVQSISIGRSRPTDKQ